MEAIVGGLMMMAGGGAIVAASAAFGRVRSPWPFADALNTAFEPDDNTPADMLELIDQLA